jgi:hypothetical protein
MEALCGKYVKGVLNIKMAFTKSYEDFIDNVLKLP